MNKIPGWVSPSRELPHLIISFPLCISEHPSSREFKLLIKLNYSWKQFFKHPQRQVARGRTQHLQVLIGRLSHRSQAIGVAGAKESVPSPAGSFGSGFITSQGDAAASQGVPSQEGW